jgi:glycosyltransferase involved in cell wall biosynthesis
MRLVTKSRRKIVQPYRYVRMRIYHIISGLNDGGAEAVLFRLCKGDRANEHLVVSLSGPGKYGPMLEALGTVVIPLGMKRGLPSFSAFNRLIRLLREERPDIVQTWMYHADLFGGLAARMAGIKSIIWGIRNSTLEIGKSRAATLFLVRLLAYLSIRIPSRIAVCARRAMEVHVRKGYNSDIMRLIPNGYDLDEYKPRPVGSQQLRDLLGVSCGMPLVGTVGRYHPQKDHVGLLKAISVVYRRGIHFRYILVGANMDRLNTGIVEQIEQLGLQNIVTLLGSRTDIPEIFNALDLHVLPSAFGEAFPNVIAEAMACETPCIATDVGDSADMIGETGWVVPPKDPEALAKAIEQALAEKQDDPRQWEYRRHAARERIRNKFGIDEMVARWTQLWTEVINECVA